MRFQPRFAFVCPAVDQCVPFTRKTAEISMRLFELFLRKHTAKDNFRNSVNDVMILAGALSCGESLLSRDSLLDRSAAASRLRAGDCST